MVRNPGFENILIYEHLDESLCKILKYIEEERENFKCGED